VNKEEIYKMNVTVENKIVRGLRLQIETKQPTRKENKPQHSTLLLKRFCDNTYFAIYIHSGWLVLQFSNMYTEIISYKKYNISTEINLHCSFLFLDLDPLKIKIKLFLYLDLGPLSSGITIIFKIYLVGLMPLRRIYLCWTAKVNMRRCLRMKLTLRQWMGDLYSLFRINASICWQQSPVQWLKEGDANSKFSNGVMSNRRSRSSFSSILVTVRG